MDTPRQIHPQVAPGRMFNILTVCRFKTQMQHVQNSEVNVENKKRHCKALSVSQPLKQALTVLSGQDMEVVKAFQSALAMLNEQLKI